MPKKQKSRKWQIQWTDEAFNSLCDCCDFLAERDEDKAIEMEQDVYSRIESLEEHPYLGPVVPELEQEPLEYRQLVIRSWPYRVIYRVEEESKNIWILRVHPAKIPIEQWLEE